MTKYLKGFSSVIVGWIKGYIFTRDWKTKIPKLIWYAVNVVGTGIIINIITELWNTQYKFLSFGLLSAITMFYLKWFRKLIVVKFNDEIDKL